MTFNATYLGSNGWIIKFKKTSLIIDPWLKGDLILSQGSIIKLVFLNFINQPFDPR